MMKSPFGPASQLASVAMVVNVAILMTPGSLS
jgi:hypothetical protein